MARCSSRIERKAPRLSRWLTNQRLRRGAFRSILELHRAIDDYLQQHNADPKPFVWTKPVNTILDNVRRAKRVMESLH